MDFRRYLAFTLILVAVFGLAAFGLVFSIDPYRLHGTSLLPETAPRPAAKNQAFVAKAHLARRLGPTTVVIGNSRVDVGVSPDSPSWPAHTHPVFNYGLPGVGLGRSLQAYRDLHKLHPARLLMIGVDFMDFLGEAKPTTPIPKGLPLFAGLTPRQALETHASLRSVTDALLTLTKQADPFSDDITVKGFNPLKSYQPMVRVEGYAALVAQRNIDNAKRLVRAAERSYDFNRHPLISELRSFLRDVVADQVSVRLIIYPYHADLLESYRIANLWRALESWKTSLVELTEEVNVGSNGPKVVLWDFARYDEFTSETVPAAGDLRREMRYYWEAGHFKPALGDLMIARIFGASSVDFGERLSAASVSRALAEQRARQLAYRIRRPSEVARVEAIIQDMTSRARTRPRTDG